MLESSWNLMAHSDAWEGTWGGNWWMEWVTSTLTLPQNTVYPTLLLLMHTSRLPVVDWTDAPADLNGLICFPKRPNLVSARAPSHFKRSLLSVLVSTMQLVGSENKFPLILGRLLGLEQQTNYWEVKRHDLFCYGFSFPVWQMGYIYLLAKTEVSIMNEWIT
jgi:hypothetical protein